MATIFAQATAPGRAGVAVIRISGDDAWAVAGHVMRNVPESRGLRAIRSADGIIDRALVLSFRGPDSFTGEDTVELHLHGSRAVVAAVLNVLGQTGARAAEAGEFTRRALENGKLDLAQVEGLADLIDAETESQRKQALRVFEGGLGALAEGWRANLIRAAALVEATIDFVDEDVPVDVYPEVLALLRATSAGLEKESAGSHIAERIRDGFEVAIVGAPNVGKSTLLNRLAGRDAAITSEFAGTTRDVIEVRMDLEGLPVTLLDTAGIRQTSDNIEEIGIDRAISRARSADLRVFLQEPGTDLPLAPIAGDIVASAKADLHPTLANGVSGKDGRGVDELVEKIGSELQKRALGAGVAIRERHRLAMQQANAHLVEAEKLIERQIEPDLIADEIRMATRAVDIIVGRVGVDDLLDEIFQSFCIGK